MKPAGVAAVDAAKADGRWGSRLPWFGTAEMPEDFLAALAREPEAEAFFATLNKTQALRLLLPHHHRQESRTRSKRIADFVAMLKRGEKLH